MGSLENLALGRQILENNSGLRKDILANAKDSKKQVSLAEIDTAKNISIVKQNAALYLVRIKWQDDILSNKSTRAKAIAGIEVFGVSEQDLLGETVELRAIAQNMVSAKLKTDNDIVMLSDKTALELHADGGIKSCKSKMKIIPKVDANVKLGDDKR